MITSRTNVQIKELVRLQRDARFRRENGLFVVEGLKLVREAAQYGQLQRIFISQSLYGQMWGGKSEREVAGDFSGGEEEAVAEIVSDPVFRQVSDTVTPQGILGTARIPAFSLEGLLQSGQGPFLLLDDLRDPGNLGTILRTAEGAGASGVILSRASVDLLNPKAVRSTMGAVFRVPFLYVPDLPAAIRKMRERQIAVFGAMMEGSIEYDKVDYRRTVGIVIGNEANGISEAVAGALTASIRIPMEGKAESLNAATAAAIILYESYRQRRA